MLISHVPRFMLAATVMVGAVAVVAAAQFGQPDRFPLPIERLAVEPFAVEQRAAERSPVGPSAQAMLPAAPAPDALPPTAGRTIPRASDGMFYVTATANGQPVRFLVDTGATVTVLTEADAALIGIGAADRGPTTSLNTVGGATRASDARIAELRLAGRRIADLQVAIIASGINVSLLGQNALSQLEQISFQKDVMTLR